MNKTIGVDEALNRIELTAHLLQLADAHVQGVVQHVDQHVAASLEGRDGGIDPCLLLQPLHRLALERRRVRGAPPALTAARVFEKIRVTKRRRGAIRLKDAIKYGAVALISVGATLAAVHTPAPSLPTTCAEAYRELQVSGLMCDHSCSREEAERAITIRDLHQQLCAKEADEQQVRKERLEREAHNEWFRLHPDPLPKGASADELLARAKEMDAFEENWIEEHGK